MEEMGKKASTFAYGNELDVVLSILETSVGTPLGPKESDFGPDLMAAKMLLEDPRSQSRVFFSDISKEKGTTKTRSGWEKSSSEIISEITGPALIRMMDSLGLTLPQSKAGEVSSAAGPETKMDAAKNLTSLLGALIGADAANAAASVKSASASAAAAAATSSKSGKPSMGGSKSAPDAQGSADPKLVMAGNPGPNPKMLVISDGDAENENELEEAIFFLEQKIEQLEQEAATIDQVRHNLIAAMAASGNVQSAIPEGPVAAKMAPVPVAAVPFVETSIFLPGGVVDQRLLALVRRFKRAIRSISGSSAVSEAVTIGGIAFLTGAATVNPLMLDRYINGITPSLAACILPEYNRATVMGLTAIAGKLVRTGSILEKAWGSAMYSFEYRYGSRWMDHVYREQYKLQRRNALGRDMTITRWSERQHYDSFQGDHPRIASETIFKGLLVGSLFANAYLILRTLGRPRAAQFMLALSVASMGVVLLPMEAMMVVMHLSTVIVTMATVRATWNNLVELVTGSYKATGPVRRTILGKVEAAAVVGVAGALTASLISPKDFEGVAFALVKLMDQDTLTFLF